MSTRFDLSPLSAQFPLTNFPQLLPSNLRMVLAFDPSTEEKCYFETVAPQGLSGAWSAIVSYRMATGTSGGVAFGVAVEAVADGDSIDLDSADSFDTENVGTDTVPATAGYPAQFTVSLSNMDSIQAGDRLRFSLARKVAHASDTATGDCYIMGVEIRDGG